MEAAASRARETDSERDVGMGKISDGRAEAEAGYCHELSAEPTGCFIGVSMADRTKQKPCETEH